MTVQLTPEEMREVGAQVHRLWAKENPDEAQARLRGMTLKDFLAAKPKQSPRRRKTFRERAYGHRRSARSIPNDEKRREAHMRKIRHER